jgi:RNA polymerase sigma-70 factor (ECF subfamily)
VTSNGDLELAGRAAAGDRAAFSALLSRHYDRIHRLAWRLTGSRIDAEDVAQDVCIKLAAAIRGFRGEADVGTWIWRITYNAATDVLRARKRFDLLAPADVMTLVDTAVGEMPEGCEQARELWARVASLPRQQRDAVTLVYGEELSHAAAAVVMGCSEKTVSWHIHEAKKRLKAMLEPVT